MSAAVKRSHGHDSVEEIGDEAMQVTEATS